ncbi:hypothetical protein ACG97_00375 [Vogesella sp. EB]|uniref:hypothetical protein n=1 Tax=Vogesella sp. EB TaxID=1526735 RepID=UPI00064D0AFD|nr:hypothetical protein [Vogesella sp. EB]KMJ54778.1 hypothetical protein ACG97_00375 [Vogesella sp. EB]
MSKTIHHYHPVTKEHIGSSEAEESPLEPGVYHVPANATVDALPDYDKATHVALYRPEYYVTGIAKEQGGAWHIVALAEPTTEQQGQGA